MTERTKIKDFYGRVLGTIEHDTVTNNKICKDFYGRVLGKYDAKMNKTKDFYGRIIGEGDQLSALLYAKK